MTEDKQRILEKIRKCMALGSSANEHEAAAAMRQARKLMDMHGLTNEHVELSELGEEAARSEHANPPLWAAALQTVIARAFQCSAYIRRRQAIFVGRAESAKVAAYTYQVLMRQIKSSRKAFTVTRVPAYLSPAQKKKITQGYCEGWVSSVQQTVADFAAPLREEDNAKHKRFMEQRTGVGPIPEAKRQRPAAERSSLARRAVYIGAADGEKVSLHHAVNRGEQAPQLALLA